MRQTRRRIPEATKPVRVRRGPGQHQGSQEAAPVLGEDRHWHQQDAQGAVRAGLLHSGPHQGKWGVEEEDLPVGEAAGRTNAPRPVGYAQRVDDLGARLMELAPEARGPRIGLGRKGVHRDTVPSRLHRSTRDEDP